MKSEYQKTILLVEDDRAARKPMCVLLSRAGWKVYEAGTLGEAVSLLKNTDLSWVVLDMMLPDGDGLSLVNEIPDGTKVAVVTGIGDPVKFAAIKSAKPDLFFRKPLDIKQLIQAMT